MLMLAAAAMGSTAVMPGMKACPDVGETGPNFVMSFLIWQAKEDGLEFASKSHLGTTPEDTSQNYKEKLYIPDFAWRPGFKLQFGYNLPYDNWSLESRWTYYGGNFTSLKKHINLNTSPEGVGVIPLWDYPFDNASSPVTPLRYQNSSANLKLFFNGFDVELGRNMLPIKTLPTRLYLGAKGAWIRQFYHAEYSNGTSFTAILPSGSSATITPSSSRTAFSSHAWGIGPRAGLDGKWNLGAGFSLIADSALSLLYSVFDLHTDINKNVSIGGTATPQSLRLKETTHELTPVAEGVLGIDWGVCFGKQSPIYFGMTFAYEMQYWWSQNHARRNYAFEAPGNMWDMRGDLQMHGLTVSLRSTF